MEYGMSSQPVKILPKDRGAKEFWKPQKAVSLKVEHCQRCGNELLLGSRYCHLCGVGQGSVEQSRRQHQGFEKLLKLSEAKLGLTPASLVCAILGVIFSVAAFTTGVVYTAPTALDWQAIQMWRIEWMLAAVVAFLAGLLFKKASK